MQLFSSEQVQDQKQAPINATSNKEKKKSIFKMSSTLRILTAT